MIDIKFVREHADVVRKDLHKGVLLDKTKDLDEIVRLDQQWREDSFQLDQKRKEKNQASEQIVAMKQRGIDIKETLENLANLSKEIKALEERVANAKSTTEKLLMSLPNITHDSVPVGKD